MDSVVEPTTLHVAPTTSAIVPAAPSTLATPPPEALSTAVVEPTLHPTQPPQPTAPAPASIVQQASTCKNCLTHPQMLENVDLHNYAHDLFNKYYIRQVTPTREVKYDDLAMKQYSCVYCKLMLVFDHPVYGHIDHCFEHFATPHSLPIDGSPSVTVPTYEAIVTFNAYILDYKVGQYTKSKGYAETKMPSDLVDLQQNPAYCAMMSQKLAAHIAATSPSPASTAATPHTTQNAPQTEETEYHDQIDDQPPTRRRVNPKDPQYLDEDTELSIGSRRSKRQSAAAVRYVEHSSEDETPAPSRRRRRGPNDDEAPLAAEDAPDHPNIIVCPHYSNNTQGYFLELGVSNLSPSFFPYGREDYTQRVKQKDRTTNQCLHCNHTLQSNQIIEHFDHHHKFLDFYSIHIPHQLLSKHGNIETDMLDKIGTYPTDNNIGAEGLEDEFIEYIYPDSLVDGSYEYDPNNSITITYKSHLLTNHTCVVCQRVFTGGHSSQHWKRSHKTSPGFDTFGFNLYALERRLKLDRRLLKEKYPDAAIIFVNDLTTEKPAYMKKNGVSSSVVESGSEPTLTSRSRRSKAMVDDEEEQTPQMVNNDSMNDGEDGGAPAAPMSAKRVRTRTPVQQVIEDGEDGHEEWHEVEESIATSRPRRNRNPEPQTEEFVQLEDQNDEKASGKPIQAVDNEVIDELKHENYQLKTQMATLQKDVAYLKSIIQQLGSIFKK